MIHLLWLYFPVGEKSHTEDSVICKSGKHFRQGLPALPEDLMACILRASNTLREKGGPMSRKPLVHAKGIGTAMVSFLGHRRPRRLSIESVSAVVPGGSLTHSYMESRMGARVRTRDVATSTPKFAAKRLEDSGLGQRINVLATLAIAVLQEVEDLRFTVTKAATNRSRALRSLDECASVQRDYPIDFYKEVERYEIDLIKKALRHTGGSQRLAAQLLNLKATTLNAKVKNYGIDKFGLVVQSAATSALDSPPAHTTVHTVGQPGPPSTNGARRKARAS